MDFINASDNSVFSLVPEYKLKPGTSIRLFYTATFDNTVLGLASATNLRSEVIVSVSKAAAGVLNSMKLIDVDDDDGPAGQRVAIDGDDSGWSQSAAVRNVFLPTPAQCNQNITLTDTQTLTNPTMTGTAAVTTFSSFNGTGILPIDGSSMSNGQTNTQDVSADVSGGVNGHYHQLRLHYWHRYDHQPRSEQLQQGFQRMHRGQRLGLRFAGRARVRRPGDAHSDTGCHTHARGHPDA